MNGNDKNSRFTKKTYSVKVGDSTYQVEVGDIHSRPIIATVDGMDFEVWPEQQNGIKPVERQTGQSQAASPAQAAPARPVPTPSGAALIKSEGGKQVLAPIPGTVLSIFVKAGDEVTPGQDLFVVEAMKMKNNIRATRAGTVGRVFVAPNQIVNHHDVLLEYSD